MPERFWSLTFCANHCHFNRNEATRLETWWQFIFEPSGDLNRVIFMIYYEKTFKIWILKNLVRIFSYFQAIFMNPWSRGKHSWLWIGRSGFESRRDQLFFSIIFSIFAFLSICGKRWDNANFKMGSAVTVSNQKVELYHFNELWRKKDFWRQPDLNRGPNEQKSAPLCTELQHKTKKVQFHFGCQPSWE